MIRRMEEKDAQAISKIHSEALKIGFLSTFGEDFLKALYEGIVQSEYGFGYVYFEDSEIVGFVSGTLDSSKLMKDIYRKKLLPLSRIIIHSTLRKPRILNNIIQSIRYPKLADHVSAELLSIAVTQEHRKKGVGKELVGALITHFDELGISKFSVSVDQRLAGADEFYKELGFKYTGKIEIYNRNQDIFSYNLGDKGSLHPGLAVEKKVKSEYFDSSDWDTYWEGKIERGALAQKLIARSRGHFGEQYLKEVQKLLPQHGGKILEVGCGTAYSTQRLGEQGYDSYALDYSPSAKKLWNKKLAHFFIADGFHIPFSSDSFDLVWNAGVLEHFPNPQDMIKEMIRVCKPKATVCVFVPYIFDFTAHLKLYGEEIIFSKKKLAKELGDLEDVNVKVLYKLGGMIICGWGQKRT
jgi:SAM-dependent methyltransferase/ribosomal protein S18 acetylase RimI-like enzyme